ncbi:Hypothetical_protein [Hexamita inflata]|uniref:Hypothetical_protein n=1 Tax=Hexamita inflata TaxID=28002 RepID=A0ABP1HBH9_9EUKA
MKYLQQTQMEQQAQMVQLQQEYEERLEEKQIQLQQLQNQLYQQTTTNFDTIRKTQRTIRTSTPTKPKKCLTNQIVTFLTLSPRPKLYFLKITKINKKIIRNSDYSHKLTETTNLIDILQIPWHPHYTNNQQYDNWIVYQKTLSYTCGNGDFGYQVRTKQDQTICSCKNTKSILQFY